MPKAQFIKTMFDDIAPKYDLLNDVLSLGTHRLWKKRLVSLAASGVPGSILDCATGTGDIAFMLESKSKAEIMGIDFSPVMISEANKRSVDTNSKVKFAVADIMNLPFTDHQFDACTISFGIRNVEDLGKSLSELSRVSKSLYVLEFGKPKNKLYAQLYFSLLRTYFPWLSRISGRKDAYDYLIASSESFPSGESFIEKLKQHTSYQDFSYTPLFGGIAYIYQAKRTT
jgi:demethylmenaquinone methyltransferase/2-methoxy-6-polyprenyl-1,4-benzoquinol methylase